MPRMRVGLVVLLSLAVAPRRVLAEGPAFDCARAQGSVQELICKDEGLAALDRKLDGVYKAARAKARDDVPKTLVAEQRGWVKGRDDCWKTRDGSPEFLTASWQATGTRACVEGKYRIRISELQAVWRLVPAKGPVSFACEKNPANEVVATFFETDPAVALLERGDQTVTTWLVPAASGSKYEGRNVEFWTKGPEATVTWLDERLKCVSK
jgi:uncharacterized protein